MFLDSLRDRATPSTPQAQSERDREDSGSILVGEDTRAKQAEAERNRQALKAASKQPAMVARALEIEETGPFIEDASAPKITIEESGGAARTPVEAEPADLKGDLADVSPVRLFARLATDRETGQLVVERGEVSKEIFLVDGAPEFVSSNVPSERFGEYLVARGVISAGELSMALAILPRFQGKLGDTLVGLSLLRPLEVFRHLTRQVRDKIIDVFAWQSGNYRYYRGRMNKREAFPLGLDAFEILGAGVAGLPMEPVRVRLDKMASKRVRRVERQRPTPEHFRVGAGPRELWQRLDGKRTVGEWMRRYEQPEQLLTLCRTLFLLDRSRPRRARLNWFNQSADEAVVVGIVVAGGGRLQRGEHGALRVIVDDLADEAFVIVDRDQNPLGHRIQQHAEATVAQHRPLPPHLHCSRWAHSPGQWFGQFVLALESSDLAAQTRGWGQPTMATRAAARSAGSGASTRVGAPVDGCGKSMAAA